MQYKGTLNFWNLSEINDAVAEVMALHEGELSLGLKELSASGADDYPNTIDLSDELETQVAKYR